MGHQRFLITAALPYSNNRLHVGHVAGAYLPADIYVRFLRAYHGRDRVRFICGSDDNGVAALKSAREEGITVEALTAKYNAAQQRAFDGLGIKFDIYGGTHQPGFAEMHEKLSQGFFLKIYDQGLFTKRTIQQLYDTEANQFLPDRFVKGTCPHCAYEEAHGDQCENCGRAMDQTTLKNPVSTMTGTVPELRHTTHWFLRLDRMQDRLADWLRSKQDPDTAGACWRPIVLNQSLGRIESEGLPERAMTRDMTWGIPVPLDDPDAQGKVLYVWFDAPIGYISFTAVLCERLGEGWQAYEQWWKDPDCKIVHFIGEDNIVFHAITFPAMMLATHESDSIQGDKGEYQLTHNVVSNAFLNIKFPGQDDAEKMSKSRGTAIWIEDYLERFEADPLRYYLTAIAPENARTAYDLADFVNRNNSELVAALGNLVNRTLTFAHKYFDGKVPEPGQRDETDLAQLAACRSAADDAAKQLNDCHIKAALAEVMNLARAGNAYFDTTAPFRTRKTDLVACGRAVNVCLQTVRTLTTVMAPFLPLAAQKCLAMLGLGEDALTWHRATEELPAGTTLGDPELLFKKLDPKEVLGES